MTRGWRSRSGFGARRRRWIVAARLVGVDRVVGSDRRLSTGMFGSIASAAGVIRQTFLCLARREEAHVVLLRRRAVLTDASLRVSDIPLLRSLRVRQVSAM